MRIRAATTSDAALLAALNRHVHALHVAAEPQVYRPHDADAIAAVFTQRLADGDFATFVAEHDGEAVGFVSVQIRRVPAHAFTHARASAMVDQLVVVPAARRAGVGRGLMAAAEAHARAHDVTRVVLDVRAFNQQAVEFYRSCGYEVEMTRFARDLDDEVRGRFDGTDDAE